MLKFIALFSSAVMVFSTLVTPISLNDEITSLDEIPSNIQYEIDIRGYGKIKNICPLLNSDNTVVAYCYEFDDAYIIFDINGKVLEHSPETNSPYYGNNYTSYYAGPLMYYVENSNDEFVELTSQDIIAYDDFVSMFDNVVIEAQYESVVNDNEIATISARGFNMETYYVDGSLRTLNYNTNGTCGAMAFQIMLYYYDDYISDEYVSLMYETYAQKFHDMLVSTYFPELGTSYTTLCDGIDQYFKDNSISNSSYSVQNKNGFNNFVYYFISSRKRPVIVGLYGSGESDSSWSIDHWVIAYGIRDYYMDGQQYNREYIVNDGWGHNNVFITYSTDYMDGAIGFVS